MRSVTRAIKPMAIDYSSINSQAVNLLLAAKKHVPLIDAQIKSLVELRVSQINGCAYCVHLHANEARKAGVVQEKLDCLTAWRESGFFNDAEMAALRWAETVTNISTEHEPDKKLQALLVHYSEAEAVDLTLIVSLMNCMNRLAISLGDRPAVN